MNARKLRYVRAGLQEWQQRRALLVGRIIHSIAHGKKRRVELATGIFPNNDVYIDRHALRKIDRNSFAKLAVILIRQPVLDQSFGQGV